MHAPHHVPRDGVLRLLEEGERAAGEHECVWAAGRVAVAAAVRDAGAEDVSGEFCEWEGNAFCRRQPCPSTSSCLIPHSSFPFFTHARPTR
jgi:hypothetical protein